VRAPVVITTYTRINHLQSTINALLKNDLAGETPVFVFSDAACSGDEEKVEAVRAYLATVRGFSLFHVVAREHNMGSVSNGVSAVNEVAEKFGVAISMEDDIVTAPGFLRYMNSALEKYRFDCKVFSISGYCPPIPIPTTYPYDAFFLRRFNGWGVGEWKDRRDSVCHITPEEFHKFAANRKLSRSFTRAGGKDMLIMLEHVANGRLDAAYDVKCMYTQFIKDQYTVYPTQSLIQNIGFDGSGIHCGKTDRFNVPLSNKTTFRLPEDVFLDERIVKANRKFRAGAGYARKLMSRTQGLVEQSLRVFKR
jgi:hypothetical protein